MRSKNCSPPPDTEQLGQLRERDRERRAGLEAKQNRFADEVDEGAEPKYPCDDGHRSQQYCRQRRDGREALRVSTCEARDRHADEH